MLFCQHRFVAYGPQVNRIKCHISKAKHNNDQPLLCKHCHRRSIGLDTLKTQNNRQSPSQQETYEELASWFKSGLLLARDWTEDQCFSTSFTELHTGNFKRMLKLTQSEGNSTQKGKKGQARPDKDTLWPSTEGYLSKLWTGLRSKFSPFWDSKKPGVLLFTQNLLQSMPHVNILAVDNRTTVGVNSRRQVAEIRS